jgi:hypothetical protein
MRIAMEDHPIASIAGRVVYTCERTDNVHITDDSLTKSEWH